MIDSDDARDSLIEQREVVYVRLWLFLGTVEGHFFNSAMLGNARHYFPLGTVAK
jgi:hypothetical protein